MLLSDDVDSIARVGDPGTWILSLMEYVGSSTSDEPTRISIY